MKNILLLSLLLLLSLARVIASTDASSQLVEQPLLLRDHEVARMLNVSKTKAYLLMASGAIPGVMRIGRCIRVHRPTLERWIAEQVT
jgi:excisionase family DNA binding protein